MECHAWLYLAETRGRSAGSRCTSLKVGIWSSYFVTTKLILTLADFSSLVA